MPYGSYDINNSFMEEIRRFLLLHWGEPECRTSLGIHGIDYLSDDEGEFAVVGCVLPNDMFAEIEDGTYGTLQGFRVYKSDLSYEGPLIQREWLGGYEIIDMGTPAGRRHFVEDVVQNDAVAAELLTRIVTEGEVIINEEEPSCIERYSDVGRPLVKKADPDFEHIYEEERQIARCDTPRTLRGLI